jgi:hypothetical protein
MLSNCPERSLLASFLNELILFWVKIAAEVKNAFNVRAFA